MHSILIVSSGEKMTEQICEVLNNFKINEIFVTHTCSEAREILQSKELDLVIINAPLQDGTGEQLCREVASKNTTGVLFAVNAEYCDAILPVVQELGVLVIEKPMKRSMLEFSIRACVAAHARIKKLTSENTKLTRTIEDIRIVNRAKRVLVTHLKMSEESAHKYIERQAMDSRKTKREVAVRIILIYENQ